MEGSLWYKQRTVSQSLYYTIRSVADKTFRIRPDLKDTFQGEFVYPLEILQDSIPFAVLQPSSTVLHVGFDKMFFDKGISHPLIETAIVGKDGMVRCIDPDIRNIDALNSYAKLHKLTQLRAHQGAAWNRTEDLKFAFDIYHGPNSGALSVPGQQEFSLGTSRNNRIEIVPAKQIDELVPEIFGSRPLNFLALTVNGAEPQALEGAKKTLADNPNLRISMALSFNNFSFEIRKQLCIKLMSEGWNVVLSNSPHAPWNPREFLWCCIVRESKEFMEQKLGASQVSWEQARELASKESLLVKNRAEQIGTHMRRAKKINWDFIPEGVFKRGLIKVKRESMRRFKK